MKVEETKETISVHSGGMVYTVRRDFRGLLHEVRDGKMKYLKPGSPGLSLARLARSGEVEKERSLGGGKLRITRSGPLAVALRYEETIEEGENKIPVVVDMVIPSSKSWVQVDCRASTPKGVARVFAARLDLEVADRRTLVDFGAGSMVYTTLRSAELAVLTEGGASGEPWMVLVGSRSGPKPFVLAPRDARPGHAEGWMHVMDQKRCTAIALAAFGHKGHDDTLGAEGTGRATVARNWAVSGEAGDRHLRFWAHFVGMPVQIGALTSPQSMLAPLAVKVKRDPKPPRP
jgi:hypothetical protein